jgi:hypothetical protein
MAFSPRPFRATHYSTRKATTRCLGRGDPFTSVCEHHMLPFTGVAYLHYLPGDRILGLSKLARLVEHFAAAAQMQEWLTKQVADWLHEHFKPRGVGVVLQAEHTRMTLHGVQARRPHGHIRTPRRAAGRPGCAGRVLRPDRCRPHLTATTAAPWASDSAGITALGRLVQPWAAITTRPNLARPVDVPGQEVGRRPMVETVSNPRTTIRGSCRYPDRQSSCSPVMPASRSLGRSRRMVAA